jgi:methyltransferase (TIGR00027 family)
MMASARALESARPDALFHDPLAQSLGGPEGAAILGESGIPTMIANSIAVRTAVIDELILGKVRDEGADLVVNLGAGLDTRPWRLEMPSKLRWLEVDLPDLLQRKAALLRDTPARCEYRSVAADITDAQQLAAALEHCGSARRALVVTEGLLVYLSAAEVSAIARTLERRGEITWWLTDLAGPRALEVLQRDWGPMLRGARFQFAPADSAAFFGALGWQETQFRSSREESRRLGRPMPLPLPARIALLFASAGFREEFRRLSGCALLTRRTRGEVAHGPPR